MEPLFVDRAGCPGFPRVSYKRIAALTVLQPTSNGIGGDVLAPVWDGPQLHGLNAPGPGGGPLVEQGGIEGGIGDEPVHAGPLPEDVVAAGDRVLGRREGTGDHIVGAGRAAAEGEIAQ